MNWESTEFRWSPDGHFALHVQRYDEYQNGRIVHRVRWELTRGLDRLTAPTIWRGEFNAYPHPRLDFDHVRGVVLTKIMGALAEGHALLQAFAPMQ